MLSIDVTKKCLVAEGWCPVIATTQVGFTSCYFSIQCLSPIFLKSCNNQVGSNIINELLRDCLAKYLTCINIAKKRKKETKEKGQALKIEELL